MLAIRPPSPRLYSLLALWAVCLAVFAEVPVPPLNARVTDLTGTLTPDQRTGLENRLKAFEAEKGSQIALLLVPTTAPETIEQYSIRVAEQWKLGRKDLDDGVLVLVAKNDRAMRIEVGRGLEGPLPDAIAKRVIAEVITPFFKQGDFYGGLSAGIDKMIGVIEGEPLPAPHRPRVPDHFVDDGSDAFGLMIFAIVIGKFLRFIVGPVLAGLLSAGAIAGVLSGMLGLPWLLGLAAGLFAFVIVAAEMNYRGGGGYYFLRGGSGGYGGSGDTFSGGGGDFGGGGASGNW